MRKVELLSPAGSLDSLKTAVLFGADAVYCGAERYGLRAKANNFTIEELKEGLKFAHDRGVRVFVTANIIAHNHHLDGVADYFKELELIGVDAVIVADPGMLAIAKEVVPNMEVHMSTQSNSTNYSTFGFWHKQGVKRVVAARELSLEEIKTVHDKNPESLDIEAFVHGAMCISYSGRCLLSNFMSGRDANLGACSHPCRWRYHLVEETRPGEYYPIEEDENGTYIYNSKDLCMIMNIPDLINAGIYSFKIEGRMKTPLYVATVTRAWREAIDDYYTDPALYESKKTYYMEEIKKASYRNFTTGFYYDRPGAEEQIYDQNTYIRNYNFVGIVLEQDEETCVVTLQQRNKFSVGDEVEVLRQHGAPVTTTVEVIWNEEGDSVPSAPHPKQIVKIKLDEKVEPRDLLRRRNDQ